MEYRCLGNTGLFVSSYALGTMTFGIETDPEDAERQLDLYIEAGGTFIDTADVYGSGRSETIIGGWLKKRGPNTKSQIVISSKAGFPVDQKGPNDVGLSRRHLRAALESSLTRLGVDHIDLYQLHRWDTRTPLEESMAFAEEAVRSGKVSYIGISNFIGWQISKSVGLTARSPARPVSVQAQYNLLCRDTEFEITEACIDAGLGLLAWSPLAGGWLTGKYSKNARPDQETRLGQDIPEWSKPMARASHRGVEAFERQGAVSQTWDILSVVEEAAQKLNVRQAHIATAWLLNQPAVTAVIIGARTAGQLASNLEGAKLKLPREIEDELTQVSKPAAGDWPYGPRGIAGRRG